VRPVTPKCSNLGTAPEWHSRKDVPSMDSIVCPCPASFCIPPSSITLIDRSPCYRSIVLDTCSGRLPAAFLAGSPYSQPHHKVRICEARRFPVSSAKSGLLCTQWRALALLTFAPLSLSAFLAAPHERANHVLILVTGFFHSPNRQLPDRLAIPFLGFTFLPSARGVPGSLTYLSG